MGLNIQGIVDRVFERKTLDRIMPVTQYEYKQREGRHMLSNAELHDEVNKFRKALVENGIEVEEKASDEEIITAMLTEEQNFGHQMKVNNYNERVTRYQEGSLVERLRIMFEGAPKKPQKNPAVDDEFYEEKSSYTETSDEELPQEEMNISPQEEDTIREILGNVTEDDIKRIKEEGNEEDAIKLAEEVKAMLSGMAGA